MCSANTPVRPPLGHLGRRRGGGQVVGSILEAHGDVLPLSPGALEASVHYQSDQIAFLRGAATPIPGGEPSTRFHPKRREDQNKSGFSNRGK